MSETQDIITDFVGRCDKAASGGGGADPYELLTDDVVVTVNGTTPLSGRYPGQEIVRNILVDTAITRFKSANVSVEEFVGQGERVAALIKLTGESVDGKAYNPKGEVGGCVFGVKDGKIYEIFMFADTTMIEMVLFNRKYVPNNPDAA